MIVTVKDSDSTVAASERHVSANILAAFNRHVCWRRSQKHSLGQLASETHVALLGSDGADVWKASTATARALRRATQPSCMPSWQSLSQPAGGAVSRRPGEPSRSAEVVEVEVGSRLHEKVCVGEALEALATAAALDVHHARTSSSSPSSASARGGPSRNSSCADALASAERVQRLTLVLLVTILLPSSSSSAASPHPLARQGGLELGRQVVCVARLHAVKARVRAPWPSRSSSTACRRRGPA